MEVREWGRKRRRIRKEMEKKGFKSLMRGDV